MGDPWLREAQRRNARYEAWVWVVMLLVVAAMVFVALTSGGGDDLDSERYDPAPACQHQFCE